MSRFLCLPAVTLLCLLAAPVAAQADTVDRVFTQRGETEFVVPAGVTQVRLTAVGEGGGGPRSRTSFVTSSRGGRGARVAATLAVSPGQRLFLNVGVGGGGAAFGSGSGGGASDVRVCPAVIPAGGCSAVPGLTDSLFARVIVAAGGGGAGDNLSIGLTEASGGNGGDASTLNQNGAAGQTIGARVGGGGASISAGGTAGTTPGLPSGSAGTRGRGGDGGTDIVFVSGAGGGGGFFGGGGSATSDAVIGGPVAGGGGGSSFANGLVPFPNAAVPTVVSNLASAVVTDGAPPSVTVTYNDTVAPTVAVTSPGDGQSVGVRPTIKGTAGTLLGDSDHVTVVAAGPVALPSFTAPVAPDGTFSATFPAPLQAGDWQVTVEQTDDGGNRTTATRRIKVDAAPPALSLTAPADGAFTRTATPLLQGVAGTKPKDQAQVRLRVFSGTTASGAPLATVDALAGQGGAYAAAPAPLPDGRYTVTATQRDDGQNETVTAPATFLVDTVAPTIDAPFLDGTQVGVGAVVGLFFTCADGGSGIAACDAPRPSGAPISTGVPGTFADTITATDRAGNVTTKTITYTVRGPDTRASDECRDTAACAPAVVKAAAGLKLTSVKAGKARRRKVAVTVRGTAGAAAKGQRLTVRATRGKRKVAKTLTLRGTTWRAKLTLPAGAGRWIVTVTLPGSATLLPATATRTLRLR